jgi:hypothetical protein
VPPASAQAAALAGDAAAPATDAAAAAAPAVAAEGAGTAVAVAAPTVSVTGIPGFWLQALQQNEVCSRRVQCERGG